MDTTLELELLADYCHQLWENGGTIDKLSVFAMTARVHLLDHRDCVKTSAQKTDEYTYLVSELKKLGIYNSIISGDYLQEREDERLKWNTEQSSN